MSEPVFFPIAKMLTRYNVTKMTIWRWRQNKELGFPEPISINGRNMWRLADLEKWEASQAGKAA